MHPLNDARHSGSVSVDTKSFSNKLLTFIFGLGSRLCVYACSYEASAKYCGSLGS